MGCAMVAAASVLAGCGGEPTKSATSKGGSPAAKTVTAPQLAAALLDQVPGMSLAYGPESGEYGSLRATQAGQQMSGETQLDKPQCRYVGQIDIRSAQVQKAPAAVVVFGNGTSSITEAVISLPQKEAVKPFNATIPSECTRYSARTGNLRYHYAIRETQIGKYGDATRAYLITAQGDGQRVRLGTAVVRHGNAVMTLLAVGSVDQRSLSQYTQQAYAKFTGAMGAS